MSRKDSIKIAGHTGAFTRAGVDFDVALVAYQRMLAGGGRPQSTTEQGEP